MSNKKVFSTLGASAHTQKEREKDDFYETPIEAVQALLSVESFTGEIWECACGKNRISNVLKDNKHEVFSSDLIDRGVNANIMNFLESNRKTNNIITNPPFKYALQFVKKALELADGKVAMLLRIQFLEGKERYEFFKEFNPSKVYVFGNRVNTIIDDKPYNSAMCLCWFVWDKSYKGDTIIKWLMY